jgi:hypothetical protein
MTTGDNDVSGMYADSDERAQMLDGEAARRHSARRLVRVVVLV